MKAIGQRVLIQSHPVHQHIGAYGVSEFWQMVIKGAVIVLAVAVDQLQSRVQAKFLPLLLATNSKVAE